MSLVQVHSLRHSQWAGSPGESSAEALGYDLVFPLESGPISWARRGLSPWQSHSH